MTANSNAGYTYDSNGNTLTKTDSTGTATYAWDYENRLTSATLPGSAGTVSFKYDPFGRRIEKISPSATSIFAYDGDNLIETTNGSGTEVAAYTQTQNIDEPLAMDRSGTIDYYEQDGLGSVTSLSSASGALAQTYTYDSFGNQTAFSGSLTNFFRYTGREFDTETGLYFNRARYYDPTVGRFISEDPIEFRAGPNFYAYVHNTPNGLTDPSGLCPCDKPGHAPSPQWYQALGQESALVSRGINSPEANVFNLLSFPRGFPLDAQAYGGSQGYANYVYGVYLAASGLSLSTALSGADLYGEHFSHYSFTSANPADQNYPHLPAVNVVSITNGYNAEKSGNLCSVPDSQP